MSKDADKKVSWSEIHSEQFAASEDKGFDPYDTASLHIRKYRQAMIRAAEESEVMSMSQSGDS